MEDDVHVNGIESFWSMLKRAHKGTYRKMSRKHLDRYVSEFVGRRLVNKDLVSGVDGRLH